jgi:hypothetical protein
MRAFAFPQDWSVIWSESEKTDSKAQNTRAWERKVIDCSMVRAFILCSAGRQCQGVGNYLRLGAVPYVRQSLNPADSDQISQIHLTASYKH